jgi:hypothetical protein
MDAAIAHERLFASVRKYPDTDRRALAGQGSNSGCGRTMLCDADGSTRMASVHRASDELCIGPIPLDRQDGRSCTNRLRINAEPLELIYPAGERLNPRRL